MVKHPRDGSSNASGKDPTCLSPPICNWIPTAVQRFLWGWLKRQKTGTGSAFHMMVGEYILPLRSTLGRWDFHFFLYLFDLFCLFIFNVYFLSSLFNKSRLSIKCTTHYSWGTRCNTLKTFFSEKSPRGLTYYTLLHRKIWAVCWENLLLCCMRSAKTQVTLCIFAVWSELSLFPRGFYGLQAFREQTLVPITLNGRTSWSIDSLSGEVRGYVLFFATWLVWAR